MADKDIIAERGRSLEDEYFRRKDKELIENMRRATTSAAARVEMGKRTGLTDPGLQRELEALGFTPETVILLPLMPVLQMAWAEGEVTPAEHRLVVKLARARGIQEGGAADLQLLDWLDHRPGEEVFTHATRLIRALLVAGGDAALTADDLVKHCEAVAAASGGMLGILGRVSAEERQLLTALAAELRGRTT